MKEEEQKNKRITESRRKTYKECIRPSAASVENLYKYIEDQVDQQAFLAPLTLFKTLLAKQKWVERRESEREKLLQLQEKNSYLITKKNKTVS